MQKSFGAVNIDILWNSVKEHVLHNFGFLAQVNQVVNKDLKDLNLVLAIWHFQLPYSIKNGWCWKSLIRMLLKLWKRQLTHLFPIHPLSVYRKVFWYFQGVEKGCIGNKWVNLVLICSFTAVILRSVHSIWFLKYV